MDDFPDAKRPKGTFAAWLDKRGRTATVRLSEDAMHHLNAFGTVVTDGNGNITPLSDFLAKDKSDG